MKDYDVKNLFVRYSSANHENRCDYPECENKSAGFVEERELCQTHYEEFKFKSLAELEIILEF